MGMSKARHRKPSSVRDLLTGLWILWLLRRRSERALRRRVVSAPPAVYRRQGLVMADAVAAATTNYPAAEPCPWGSSYGACMAFHPVDHVSRYAAMTS